MILCLIMTYSCQNSQLLHDQPRVPLHCYCGKRLKLDVTIYCKFFANEKQQLLLWRGIIAVILSQNNTWNLAKAALIEDGFFWRGRCTDLSIANFWINRRVTKCSSGPGVIRVLFLLEKKHLKLFKNKTKHSKTLTALNEWLLQSLWGVLYGAHYRRV